MKLTRLSVRVAACVLPLTLAVICVVTPLVVSAEEVPQPVSEEAATTANEAPVNEEPRLDEAEPADADVAGEVRISDLDVPKTQPAVVAADTVFEEIVNSASDDDSAEDTADVVDVVDTADVAFDESAGEVTLTDLWHEHSLHFIARNRQQSEAISTWMHETLGLYTPANVQAAPVGRYHMIYPVNPSYTDPRDTKVYGAQGAGIPIVVPLAPNVRAGYNYGSGIPASRLTPISVPR